MAETTGRSRSFRSCPSVLLPESLGSGREGEESRPSFLPLRRRFSLQLRRAGLSRVFATRKYVGLSDSGRLRLRQQVGGTGFSHRVREAGIIARRSVPAASAGRGREVNARSMVGPGRDCADEHGIRSPNRLGKGRKWPDARVAEAIPIGSLKGMQYLPATKAAKKQSQGAK